MSGIKHLWAPWRGAYVRRGLLSGCIFCRARRATNDRRAWVVHRGPSAFVMLNLYPYTNGHLLIAPYRHVGRLQRLREAELLELMQLTCRFMERLDRAISPHGYNMGINIGRAAGAGVPGHLHLHLVPRWEGDTNFMTSAASLRVISDSLDAMYELLT